MKYKKTIIIIRILFVISLLICLQFISNTYAKYQEQVDTNYQIGIKRWNVVINNKDVQTTTSLTEMMVPVFVYDENINTNVIVPGREGYFDVNLDYSKVDVPFKVTVKLKCADETKLADFQWGYNTASGFTGIMDPEDETVMKEMYKIIDPTEIEEEERIEIFKILFLWNDDENNKMDNLADTQFRGLENPNENILNTLLNYEVTIEVKQYVEELENPRVTLIDPENEGNIETIEKLDDTQEIEDLEELDNTQNGDKLLEEDNSEENTEDDEKNVLYMENVVNVETVETDEDLENTVHFGNIQ